MRAILMTIFIFFSTGSSLDIYIRSAGYDDPGKTYIRVNGLDRSSIRRGHNVVILNANTGSFLGARTFDTTEDSTASIRLRNYLNGIRGDNIVLVAIHDSGSNHLSPAIPALKRLGATDPILTSFRSSFAFVGYAGARKPRWITQVQHRRYEGPSEIRLTLPITVHGEWSSWEVWTICSKTCDPGTQHRYRSCTQPRPQYGGRRCPGAAQEQRVCNTRRCPVDGFLSSWGVWTTCTKTCESGTQARSRSCTPPKYGGKPCPGATREQRVCNTRLCPVDGGWSEWGNWTECSVTCGIGVMSRERKCDNPPRVAEGRPCQGNRSDVKSCNTTKHCIDRVGCFGNFPSTLLGSFRDDINWFVPLPFSKQMEKMIKKCSRVTIAKKLKFFAVENYGNCYGAQEFSPDSEAKSTRCNFGVGLENCYYVYNVFW